MQKRLVYAVTVPISDRQYSKRKQTVYIQGDSGGICITLGNDSMSDSKQKSS